MSNLWTKNNFFNLLHIKSIFKKSLNNPSEQFRVLPQRLPVFIQQVKDEKQWTISIINTLLSISPFSILPSQSPVNGQCQWLEEGKGRNSAVAGFHTNPWGICISVAWLPQFLESAAKSGTIILFIKYLESLKMALFHLYKNVLIISIFIICFFS
jgi:hypothetical protein